MNASSEIFIRPAEQRDLLALGRLGALLMQTHFAFDSRRFMSPQGNAERGYARFLATQLKRDDVVVLVAERAGDILGYVYAGIEPQSWKELREEAGFIHDVVVEERGRRMGAATALIDKAIEWLRSVGAARVILWTAAQNDAARHLFSGLGFRQTMIEMTKELAP